MKLKAFCSSERETQVLNWIYIILLILITGVSGIAGYRLITDEIIKRSPSGLNLGVASLVNVFIQYIVLTTKVKFFKKWANLKAYFILNIVSCVAWAVAGGFTTINLAVENCKTGSDCTLTGTILGLIGLVLLLSISAAYLSAIQFLNANSTGVRRPEVARMLPTHN